MAEHSSESVSAAIVDILLGAHELGLSLYNILLTVISHPSIVHLIEPLPNYTKLQRMAQNLESTLHDIAKRGRQTGLYHLVLGSVAGPNLDPSDLVDVLNIDIRTARKTLELQQVSPKSDKSYKRAPLVSKPLIKRQRVAGVTINHIHDFLHNHTYASSDMKKVKTITDVNGNRIQAQIRYRTDSFQELYDMFKVLIVLLIFYC